MSRRTESISVVIPVHNGGLNLRRCLESLAKCRGQFTELIVADDGSTDDTSNCAVEYGAKVLSVGARRGPACGRNLGISFATGDIVLCLDADVCVAPQTISMILKRFGDDPGLGALFGSYDADPAAPGLVSQFRNLLHCFIHRTSSRHASTFWAGCGAIRRHIFIQSGGFDLAYSVPCVEDIELGMRLVKRGVRIALDPSLEVKHLKRWTLRGMVVTDIKSRGIPWTRLILESRRLPNDLNLQFGSRASVALTGGLCLLTALSVTGAVSGAFEALPSWGVLLFSAALGGIVGLNFLFYQFLAAKRSLFFAIRCVPLHLLYFLCCGVAFFCGVVIHCSYKLMHGLGRASTPAFQPRE